MLFSVVISVIPDNHQTYYILGDQLQGIVYGPDLYNVMLCQHGFVGFSKRYTPINLTTSCLTEVHCKCTTGTLMRILTLAMAWWLLHVRPCTISPLAFVPVLDCYFTWRAILGNWRRIHAGITITIIPMTQFTDADLKGLPHLDHLIQYTSIQGHM